MSSVFKGSDTPPPAPLPEAAPALPPSPRDAALREQKVKQLVVGGGVALSADDYDRGRRKKLGAANDILLG